MSEFDMNTQGQQEGLQEAKETYARRMADLAESLPVIGPAEEEAATNAQAPSAAPAQDQVTMVSPNEFAKMEREGRHRKWPIVLLVLVLLAGAAYVGGAVAFMNYFMPNTTLNGEDVSLKSIDEVAEKNASSVSNVSFAVTGDGLDLHLSASDLKASYDGASFARRAMAQQQPWEWPLQIAGTHNLSVESPLSYDEARLDDIVGSAIDAINKDAVQPQDAKVIYSKKNGRYRVKGEKPGTVIDKTAAIAQVRDAMKALEPAVELGEDVLVKPAVTSDDKALNDAVTKANGCLEATQDIVLHDETVATVGEELLHEWVGLSKDLTVTFDDDACTAWARGALSEKLDTYGSTRTYKRPDGKKVTVSGGTYGWIIDGAAIAEEIATNVKAGQAGTVGVSFKQEAAKWNPGGKEWGNKYIDIDLSEQHVRYYDGKSILLECDCVSGGLDDRGEMHATPTGVFYINDNMRSGNIKLTGKPDPVTLEPIYISYVDYWMPFEGDSVALHDADWRGSFGGEIYKSNGSHGCVNLPVDKARELYGMVSVGTVVVVHD